MNNLYNVLDELRTLLLLSDFTNTVTFGEVSDVDLNKLTNFPLVHLNVDNVTIDDLHIDFTLNMIACDVVDISKEEVSDLFLGNNNVQDILSTQLKVITDAYEVSVAKTLNGKAKFLYFKNETRQLQYWIAAEPGSIV